MGFSGESSLKRAVPAITVAASNSPAFMKDLADYVCTGSADDGPIQAAINEAAGDLVLSTFGIPTVRLAPGSFHLSAGLQWKSCNLCGAGPAIGTYLYWDGASGGTAITRTTDSGGSSWGRLGGMTLKNGVNQPGTWVDFSQVTTAQLDSGMRLSELQFIGGSGPQIKLAGFLNLHWEYLRFDSWGTYAIESITPASANLGTFRLSGFTADNAGSTTSRGLIHIDNTAANASNLGTLKLEDGRIELNSLYASGSQAGVIVLTSGNPGQSQYLKTHLSNVSYQDVVGNASDVLINNDTASTTQMPSLILENVDVDGLSAVYGGSIWAGAPTPPLLHSYGYLALDIDTSGGASITADTVTIRTYTNGDPLIITRLNETGQRLRIHEGGQLNWGDGADPTDTTLYRNAAGFLKSDGQLQAVKGVITFVKAGAPVDADFTTPTDGTIVVDTTNNKMWTRLGGLWKGVVVS